MHSTSPGRVGKGSPESPGGPDKKTFTAGAVEIAEDDKARRRKGIVLYNGLMVIILFKSVLLSLLLSVGLSLLIGKFDSIVKWWRKQQD